MDEVYLSKNIYFSDKLFPDNKIISIENNKNFFNLWKKYFVLNNHIKSHIERNKNGFVGHKTLGVHFRGKEMRTAGGHQYPPTLRQIKFAINKILALQNYDKIFVSSEDFKLIQILQKEYPDKIIYNKDYYRSTKNAYKEYPREFHKFKLGREVLTDMYILSECDSFISNSSNVSGFSRFVNNGNYKYLLVINNGFNYSRYKLYMISWYIKRLFPSFLFGFKKDSKTMKLYSK